MNIQKLFLIVFFLFSNYTFGQIQYTEEKQVLIGPGQFNVDMNKDGSTDYVFDIITLSAEELAARVLPQNYNQILDQSTYGYADRLDSAASLNGNYHSNTGVLGTFTGAGQFSGKGISYLGIQLDAGSWKQKGWIKLYCSEKRDTLIVFSYAFQSNASDSIVAGQKESSNGIGNPILNRQVVLYPNPAQNQVHLIYEKGDSPQWLRLYSATGELLSEQKQVTKLSIQHLAKGLYFLQINYNNTLIQKMFLKE